MTNGTVWKADVQELRAKRGKTHIDPNIQIADVCCDDSMLFITLADGRLIGAPLAWFPRLQEATPEQRANWELWPARTAVRWPDLDEDISARVLMGHPS